MATAANTLPAAPAVSDHPGENTSASPHLASGQQLITTPNGSGTPGPDGILHPGLRLDMRNANGAQRDGRVRNPIPSKLKGKTDEKKGNFRVMHMDISNTSESQARYDAAKRSSENTALQAKMAETDHYVSHHRRANYARSKSQKEPDAPAQPLVLPPRTAHLTADEVKTEQARLLTLLRTLPHANIVDQICKALAFFGGIPDAPPPVDGKFPDSGDYNGPGNLFVGWLSEIFPDLERPRRPVVQLSAPPKRPRGRPKGSKATKARKDKGIKKNTKGPDGTILTGPDGDHQPGDDEGWEDVNDSVLDVSRHGESVEDRVLLLQTPPQNPAASSALPASGPSGFTSINPASTPVTSVKKRGRPKGSKNKAKEPNVQGTPQQAEASAGPAPTTTSTFQPAVNIDSTPTPAVEATKKKPRGGKKKAANDAASASAQQPPTSQAGTSTSYIPPPTLPIGATMTPVPAQAAVRAASSTAERTNLPSQIQNLDTPEIHQSVSQTTPQVTPQVKESTITGAKRKRQNNKPATKTTDYLGGDHSVDSRQPDTSGQAHTAGLNMSTHGQPQPHANTTPVADSTTPVPPAKKPRKSNVGPMKRKSTTGTPGDLSSVVSSDHISNQTTSQTNDNTSQTRPQPEGLQAHLERFASLQSNNDQTQTYGAQQPTQQQVSNSVNTSSAPVEGLEAHYERFASMPSRQHSTQQTTNARQQSRQVSQQHPGQSASPVPPQISKTPQMATLPSQQQNRASTNTPNYYALQNQTPGFVVQQGSYTTNQRQSQNTSTSSPGTGLVSHVTHSPQYATQSSNSPLMSNETAFRGSPSLGFAPRRTTSASPMDNTYRTNSVTSQGFANPRQAPATTHAGVTSGFYNDNSLFDLQGFDSTSGSNIGLGSTGSYNMGNGNVQRTNSASNNSSAYTNTSMTNGTYDQTGLNKGAMNNGSMNNNYRNQARWA